jgi:8-oxo-dGTP pyrophosphatase MutT (NUDIX family)
MLELNHAEIEGPVRPAASVILLRDDSDAGVLVYLLKRRAELSTLAGAYVFPGGKVDREDGAAEALDLVEGLDSAAALDRLVAALGEPELEPREAAALHVAAIRETFEECAVLLAASAPEPALIAQAQAWMGDGMSMLEAVQQLGLRLSLAPLAPWSRWITPRVPAVMRKRFDTRFFVAALPAGQEPHCASAETETGEWIAPRAALEAYWDRRIDLAPPQIMTLAHLARFADVPSVIAEARSRTPATVLPHPFQLDGQRAIAYPGDVEHPVNARAMPGPTRLMVREGRFEPLGGFDEWFD